MKTSSDGKRNIILVAVVSLLLSIWTGSLSVAVQELEFDVYTFSQDASIKVGYPRGWTVQEGKFGIVVREKMADDSAVILILVGQLLSGVTTSEQLAESMINSLRKSGYPDLEVIRQQPHPKTQNILTIDATFSVRGVPFLSHIWCAVNQQMGIGVFAVFYAPESRYGAFDVQQTLFSSLSPMLGLEESMRAQPRHEAAADPGSVNKDILFVNRDDKRSVLCSLDPSSKKVTQIKDFGALPVAQPTRSLDGSVMILAIPGMKRLLAVKGIKKYEQDLPSATDAFPMAFELGDEGYIYSPSISRDSSLVAVRMLLYQDAGKVYEHKASAEAYRKSLTGEEPRVRLASFEIRQDIQEYALYYEDPDPPEANTDRLAWRHAFSPTEDILAYMSRDDFIFVDARTGEATGRITPETPVNERSGFTFSPDGRKLVYMGAASSGKPDSVVILDIPGNTSKEYPLPEKLRPTSITAGVDIAVINPDFSPDGKFIVFSAEAKGDKSDDREIMCNIYILDLSSGETRQMTTDGKSFDPVWKGR